MASKMNTDFLTQLKNMQTKLAQCIPTNIKKISETEYDLVSKAIIDNKWHLYSQVVPEDGPLPTVFTFEANDAYKLVGKVKESKGVTELDPVFDMVITYFENTATFTQRIKLTGNQGTTITGEVEFMVCDDTNCLPPTYIELIFNIPAPAPGSAVIDTAETVTDTSTNNDKEVAATKEFLDSLFIFISTVQKFHLTRNLKKNIIF